MDFKDYYAILGVARTASDKDIKAAYRRLARKHHPDVNKGQAQAEVRFKEIGEAYAVLSDAERRRQYDELLAGGRPSVHRRSAGGARRSSPADAAEFSEFFRTFFGAGTAFGAGEAFGSAREFSFPSEPAPPEPVVELTLAEVLRGATRELAVEGRRVEVKIPPGVKDGARVRVAGAGSGPRRRDLFLRVALARDPRFERRDDDLLTTFEVPVSTAVLGGDALVPTLEGEVTIRIPELTPAGRTFRLRGQGLPTTNGERGDLLASLSVRLPRALEAGQRQLFEELRRAGL